MATKKTNEEVLKGLIDKIRENSEAGIIFLKDGENAMSACHGNSAELLDLFLVVVNTMLSLRGIDEKILKSAFNEAVKLYKNGFFDSFN